MSDAKLIWICLTRQTWGNPQRINKFVSRMIEARISAERFSVAMTIADVIFTGALISLAGAAGVAVFLFVTSLK